MLQKIASVIPSSLPIGQQRNLNGSLPDSYRKLVATQLTTDFRAAAKIVEAETPALQTGDVLVRMCYASVNASDVLKTNGFYGDTELPFDLGIEGVGQVVSVGPAIPGSMLGKYVALSDTGESAGCFGEYRVINMFKSYAVPVGSDNPKYAAMMVTGVSASVALNECAKIGTGETVLITAAAGSGGTFSVQMAKQKGNHVIGTCGSKEKADMLYGLGCDRVINYREEDVGDVLGREYEKGVNLVVDSVGGELFDTCVDHIAERGRLVVFGYISDYKDGAGARKVRPVYDRLLDKSAEIRGFAFKHYAKNAGKHAFRVLQDVRKGKLKAVIDPTEFNGVEDVVNAVEHHHGGKNIGKVVVRF